MFKEACEILGKQVRPIFVATRQGERPPRYAVGAAVMVNSAGWMLTAGHVVRAALQALAAQKEFDGLSRREQRKRIKQNPETITRAGVRWGAWDEPSVTGEILLHTTADLALFRLSGVVSPDGYEPPVFRADGKPGESVCRVGYALLDDIVATSDGDLLRLEQWPPLFVNDGIVARYFTVSGISHIRGYFAGSAGSERRTGRGQARPHLRDPGAHKALPPRIRWRKRRASHRSGGQRRRCVRVPSESQCRA